jgi:hypothetical protein
MLTDRKHTVYMTYAGEYWRGQRTISNAIQTTAPHLLEDQWRQEEGWISVFRNSIYPDERRVGFENIAVLAPLLAVTGVLLAVSAPVQAFVLGGSGQVSKDDQRG